MRLIVTLQKRKICLLSLKCTKRNYYGIDEKYFFSRIQLNNHIIQI